MKRFSFPLEAALQQRVRQEQAVQLELARAARDRAGAAARLSALQQERAALSLGTAAAGERLDVEARMNVLYYFDRCTLSIDEQTHVVRAHEEEIGRVRAQLTTAAARRRALERLRERRRHDYDTQLNRRLDNQLDELVTMRHGLAARQGEQVNADY